MHQQGNMLFLHLAWSKVKVLNANILLKDRNNNSQYALIKNLSHVVRLCYSKCRSQHFFCPYGLYEYMSQEKLNKKMDICKRRGTQQIQAGNLLLMPYCLEANRTPWRQRFECWYQYIRWWVSVHLKKVKIRLNEKWRMSCAFQGNWTYQTQLTHP